MEVLKRAWLVTCAFSCAALLATPAWSAAHAHRQHARPHPAGKRAVLQDSDAEARLLAIYRLIAQAHSREALAKSEALVRDHPNFQLAQLVYGDLLMLQTRPVRGIGDVPELGARNGGRSIEELREESQLRIRALLERPPAGAIPSQFLQLSAQNKHAIAVDTSRARLYLFENSPAGLRLVADYYISVGKLGIDKNAEGDLRTPLGVYFVTSNLDPKTLKDFYGAGALPINYPNPYDARRGKTGGGIWLHGSPPAQFARAPKATDGCVVLSNPDLQRIINTVEVRTTPVVIAPSLTWVAPPAVQPQSKQFGEVLQAWRSAKVSGDPARILGFYSSDFNGYGKSLPEWTPVLKAELDRAHGRDIAMKDLSFLQWSDKTDTMVVTFGEVIAGERTGPVKRQYWLRQGLKWKIFFEGVIG